jgi:hypothetical protein
VVGHDERAVLRGVARRVEHGDLDLADADRLTVGQWLQVVAHEPARRLVDPVRRAGQLGELARARDEVGVHMGLEHGDDVEAEVGRFEDVEVGAEVGDRVDHDALAGARAAEHVGGLRERLVADLLEDHPSSSPLRSRNT